MSAPIHEVFQLLVAAVIGLAQSAAGMGVFWHWLRTTRWVFLAPLFFHAAQCCLGMIELMMGTPVGYGGAALILVGLLPAIKLLRKDQDYRAILIGFSLLFGLLFMILASQPSPGIYLAGGDWHLHLQKLAAAMKGQFNESHLDRSPLFALGGAPFALILPIIKSGILHSSWVAAAAVWGLLAPVTQTSANTSLSYIQRSARQNALLVILVVACSPFVVMSAQNIWPKLSMAGAALAMIQVASVPPHLRCRTDLLIAWLFFWLGMGWHLGHVIFGPLMCLLLWQSWSSLRPKRMLAWLGWLTAPILCFGSYELWSLIRFGLEAKISSNPVVTFATELPFFAKVAQNLLSTIVGDQALVRVWHIWSRALETGALSDASKAAYFTGAAWLPWLSGSIAGIVLSFWPIIRAGPKSLRTLSSSVHPTAWTGLIAAFVISQLLMQGGSHWGAVQAGLPGVVFALVRLIIIPQTRTEILAASLRHVLLIGLLPYWVFNLGVTALLSGSFTFLNTAKTELLATDGDLIAVGGYDSSGWVLLGFPWVSVVVTGCLALLVYSLGRYNSRTWPS